jgi:hypothetical protein
MTTEPGSGEPLERKHRVLALRAFLRENRAWWLGPILLVALMLLAVIVLAAAGGFLPLMYRQP